VQQQDLAARLAQLLLGIDRVRGVACVHRLGEAVEPLLEMAQRLEHLGDALARDVLERARLEDGEDTFLDEAAVVLVGEAAGTEDFLGRRHDGVRRRGRGLQDGAEFVVGRRDALARYFVRPQRPDLPLHVADVVGHGSELAHDDLNVGVGAGCLGGLGRLCSGAVARRSGTGNACGRGCHVRTRRLPERLHQAPQTASILVFNVCALNGLTM
jgi:hypothetical protein